MVGGSRWRQARGEVVGGATLVGGGAGDGTDVVESNQEIVYESI